MTKFSLFRSHLTQGEDDYLAIPHSPVSKKIEDLISQMTLPGSILKKTECVAVIHEFFRVIASNLREGVGFTSEYLRIGTSLSGVFDGPEDQFDPERHQLEVYANAGSVLKAAAEDQTVQIGEGDSRKPEIKRIFEWSEGSSGRITPHEPMEIFGQLLKYDPKAKDEGIYLIPTGNGHKEYKADFIRENRPKKLSTRIPRDLPAGAYRLEVRNRILTNKSLRTGAYEKVLIVK